MRRDELAELHYITPIANVPSILSHGILCHRRASKILHDSVAKPGVQSRRAVKVVPGGGPLHNYANLYINARNPMMYRRREMHADLTVLRVSPEVFDLEGVIVTDMNAARRIARFRPPESGLAVLDRELIFADDWRHPGDRLAYERHQGIMCAEVLVPNRVDPTFLMGAYVSCDESMAIFKGLGLERTSTVNPHLFFR